MMLALRDDDLCYFSKIKEIEKAYKDVWNVLPISFATIPFINPKNSIGGLDNVSKIRDYPLGENKELTRFIKNKIKEGQISIMLHGYNHSNWPDGTYEYNLKSFETLYERTLKGKQYLEELFDMALKTFVPPHGELSKQGDRAVVSNKLNIAGASLTSRIFFRYDYLKNLAKVLIYKKRNLPYPYLLKFSDHKEVWPFRFEPDVKWDVIKRAIDFTIERDGILCLSTHLGCILSFKHHKENLKRVIEYCKEYSVDFVSVDDFWK